MKKIASEYCRLFLTFIDFIIFFVHLCFQNITFYQSLHYLLPDWNSYIIRWDNIIKHCSFFFLSSLCHICLRERMNSPRWSTCLKWAFLGACWERKGTANLVSFHIPCPETHFRYSFTSFRCLLLTLSQLGHQRPILNTAWASFEMLQITIWRAYTITVLFFKEHQRVWFLQEVFFIWWRQNVLETQNSARTSSLFYYSGQWSMYVLTW